MWVSYFFSRRGFFLRCFFNFWKVFMVKKLVKKSGVVILSWVPVILSVVLSW